MTKDEIIDCLEEISDELERWGEAFKGSVVERDLYEEATAAIQRVVTTVWRLEEPGGG